MLRKITFLILVSLSFVTMALGKYPALCRVSGLHYVKKSVSLFSQHTAKPRLYAIYNQSQHAIWLTHEKKHPSVSAGWDSQLAPERWSALLVTRRRFGLNCRIQDKTGKMTTLPCRRVIRICQYSDFYSKNPVLGGYWVAENLPYKKLIDQIRARGFTVETGGQK